jgi:Domain of unknown function (DUF4157)
MRNVANSPKLSGPSRVPVCHQVLQRACACGTHAAGGECAECRKKKLGLQRKLTIGASNDPMELEADRISDQVLAIPATTSFNKAPARIQRVSVTPIGSVGNAPPSVDRVLSSPGRPLDRALRKDMEQRFGYDFSNVRVHTDPAAGQSAIDVNARAYTVGHDIVFGTGQYSPNSHEGRRLLSHELTHVVQQSASGFGTGRTGDKRDLSHIAFASNHQHGLRLQRVVGEASGSGASSAGASGASRTTGPARPGRLHIDVLAAEDPDDFLVRAAAQDLGTDIRVRSMTDMVDQVTALAGTGSCVASLEVFNHGNPQLQAVSGGNKVKSAEGEVSRRPISGFDRSWLFNPGNRDALQRLRGSFCCNGETHWFGCSTAGVLAESGRRTEAERRTSEHRYSDYRAEFYQSVEDAAAHGATHFRSIGSVNVQSWTNALCTPITAATDFNNWDVRGSGYTRTVVYGGRELRFTPQADVGCACDADTGRISGTLQSAAQMRQRASELRERTLHPTYERARGVIGREQPHVPESEEQQATRQRFEAAQQEHFDRLAETIRASVLHRAGFASDSSPTTPEEALRVTELWGLDLNRITSAMPALTASTAGAVRGHTGSDDLARQQRSLEAALTQRGRETFMQALLEVRRDRFWDEHLRHTTIYIFPDLSGVNRYRGFTQSGSYSDDAGQTHQAYIVHISREMLNGGQQELVVANLIHELTHTVHEPNVLDRATRAFNQDLAELLADHPQIRALRSTATNPTAARAEHVSRIRQMLYEVTGYAEGEIFAHLQQLSHQPAMTIDGRSVRASDFILDHVTMYMVRLRHIGLPPRMLAGLLVSIRRRVMMLYERRIAASTEGSLERREMEANKRLADSIFQLALTLSEEHP